MGIESIWRALRGAHDEQKRAAASGPPTRHVIILAGGSGKRLSHLSRALTGTRLPKQFCGFDPDGLTMLQHSVGRADRLVGARRTHVVVCKPHDRLAAHQLRAYPGTRLLAQPDDRGSAVGLALALAELLEEHANPQVVVLPVDAAVADEAVCDAAIETAFRAQGDDGGRVIVLTCEPTAHSSEQHTWLVPPRDDSGVQRVARVVGRPNDATARELIGEGGAWSTMMLVGSARAMLAMLARDARPVVRLLRSWASLDGERSPFLERVYRRASPLDLSRDVLEHADDLWMLTLPAAAGWTDLGQEACLRGWVERRSGHLRSRSSIPSVA